MGGKAKGPQHQARGTTRRQRDRRKEGEQAKPRGPHHATPQNPAHPYGRGPQEGMGHHQTKGQAAREGNPTDTCWPYQARRPTMTPRSTDPASHTTPNHTRQAPTNRCAVLRCAVLRCAVLRCTVACCAVLCCALPWVSRTPWSGVGGGCDGQTGSFPVWVAGAPCGLGLCSQHSTAKHSTAQHSTARPEGWL